MNELKFNSQVCTTKEQSQHLLDLGLNPETADMVYTDANLPYKKGEFRLICKEYLQLHKAVNYEISPFTFIPAWSLHRLIELYSDVEDTSYWCIKSVSYKLLICCIEKAIRCGFLNKEYLKQ